MTNPDSDLPIPPKHCVAGSSYTQIMYVDGDGDTTIRPIPPDRRKAAEAERDKILKWLAAQEQEEEEAKQPKPTDPEA